jgi:hypothetical protein
VQLIPGSLSISVYLDSGTSSFADASAGGQATVWLNSPGAHTLQAVTVDNRSSPVYKVVFVQSQTITFAVTETGVDGPISASH